MFETFTSHLRLLATAQPNFCKLKMLFKLSFRVVLLLLMSLTTILACPKNFKGDMVHEDMNKFYRCHYGSHSIISCPNGQEFHPKLKVCLKSILKISPLESPCSGITVGLVPHETDCTKFYFCSDGIQTQYDCPDGQEFDENSGGCADITGSGCTSTITPTTENIGTDGTTIEAPTTEDPVIDGTTDVTPSTEDTEITTMEYSTGPQSSTTQKSPCSGIMVGFVPHESDCTKYYFCVAGAALERQCPDGQEFDEDAEGCVAITGSGCTSTITPTTEDLETDGTTNETPTTEDPATDGTTDETPTTEDPETTTMEYSTEQQSSTTQKSICSETQSGAVPHECDCTKYYLCTNGIPQEFQCSDGQEFDEDITECVDITGSGCTTTIFPTTEDLETDGTTNETPTTEDPATDGTTDETSSTEDPETTTMEYSTEQQSSTTQKSLCSGIIVGFVPHESDCTKYYFCVAGTAQERQCPDGQEFDEDAEGCVAITGSGCTSTITPTTEDLETDGTTNETPTTEDPATDGTTDETPTTEDPETATMEYSTEQQSSTTQKSICSETQSGAVPHESDCTKYYLCTNGIPQEFQCSDGQEFDEDITECVDITGSGCTTTIVPTTEDLETDGTTNETPTTEDPATDGTTDETSSTEDPETTTMEYSTEQQSSTTQKLICSEIEFGAVPHESDCTKYYICMNGIPYELQCPSGHKFDANAKQCVELKGDRCSSSNVAWPGSMHIFFNLLTILVLKVILRV
ncbi:uncharacterized protein LOC143912546 [Arctopsyche grandis]|uniref:uncharacterized protein LOC143912546 n=1 Tax=Arctopsyche grandis TaxID=121162 RepID=UPI00406D705A